MSNKMTVKDRLKTYQKTSGIISRNAARDVRSAA